MKSLFRIVFVIVLLVMLLLALSFPVLAAPLGDTAPGVTFVPTPEALVMIAAVVLSLAFSYIPGLRVKFASLDATYKSLIMLVLLFLISAAVFGLSCASVLTGVTCDKPGLIQLSTIFIMAMIANQSTYQLSPPMNDVKAAKLAAILPADNPEIPDRPA